MPIFSIYRQNSDVSLKLAALAAAADIALALQVTILNIN